MNASAFMIALGILATYAFIGLIWYALYVIGCWKVFSKAGEAGWKALIPLYNSYISYKICWNTSMFWVMIATLFLGSILSQTDSALGMVGSLLSIISGIVGISHSYKMSRAFGHGIGFAVGLVFLNPIFIMILGFGHSRYEGPQY